MANGHIFVEEARELLRARGIDASAPKW